MHCLDSTSDLLKQLKTARNTPLEHTLGIILLACLPELGKALLPIPDHNVVLLVSIIGEYVAVEKPLFAGESSEICNQGFHGCKNATIIPRLCPARVDQDDKQRAV